MDKERYLRQILLKEIGEEGQKRLNDSSVLIVGAGGLGSIVATYLNGAGIGKIGVVDKDVVSISNLHRQILYKETQVGMSKAERAVDFLKERSEHTVLCSYPESLEPSNATSLIGEFDVIVDCTDNYCTRFLIDDTCRSLGKAWVYGAIGEFVGQIGVFAPDSEIRFSDLYPDRDFLCSLPPSNGGVVGPVPGVTASLQAMETIKLIVGIDSTLVGKLFTINLLTLETNIIEV